MPGDAALKEEKLLEKPDEVLNGFLALKGVLKSVWRPSILQRGLAPFYCPEKASLLLHHHAAVKVADILMMTADLIPSAQQLIFKYTLGTSEVDNKGFPPRRLGREGTTKTSYFISATPGVLEAHGTIDAIVVESHREPWVIRQVISPLSTEGLLRLGEFLYASAQLLRSESVDAKAYADASVELREQLILAYSEISTKANKCSTCLKKHVPMVTNSGVGEFKGPGTREYDVDLACMVDSALRNDMVSVKNLLKKYFGLGDI